MEYKLKEFTEESLKATSDAWNSDLQESPDIFPGDVWRVIKLAQDCSDYKNDASPSLAYGIFDGDEGADSIVEIIVSQSGKKWIKMLDCFIRPSISEKAYQKDADSIQKLVAIYAAAIIGSIRLADQHKAILVKVFGRSEALLYVLTSVAKYVNESDSELAIKADIQGRWLVVVPINREK